MVWKSVRTASRGRTTTNTEWSWTRSKSSGKEKDEEAARDDLRIEKENTMYKYEEFGNQCDSRTELEKQGDPIKKDMECLDRVKHFRGQDDVRERRTAQYQLVCKIQQNGNRLVLGLDLHSQTWTGQVAQETAIPGR